MRPKRKKKAPPARRPLLYKVIELSTVDEAALEKTLNEWTAQGWKLDGIQFAMRESSKRPSMAFVFFTREGRAVTDSDEEITVSERGRSVEVAEVRFRELAGDGSKVPAVVSALQRLAELAGDDDL